MTERQILEDILWGNDIDMDIIYKSVKFGHSEGLSLVEFCCTS